MASKRQLVNVAFTLASLLQHFSSSVYAQTGKPAPPPAIWIFGDSLVDPGNNNYLPATLAKANFPYNGIDFKGGATGRFCNGRTVVDVECDVIGIPYPPPYLAPATKAGNNILLGVNYASAAGGILDASGGNYIQRIGLNQQIAYFRNTLGQLQAQIGPAQTTTLLAKSIVNIVIGNNDFINNYLLTDTTTKYQYNVRDYNILLLNNLNRQMTDLYDLGFRKIIIAATGPIGCIPDQLAIAQTTTCIASTNAQIQDFNTGLIALVRQLNNRLAGATFVYANVYTLVNNLIESPSTYGFKVNNQGCCGAGLYNGQVPCLPNVNLCSDHNSYIFWDAYHPTEAANIYLANQLYSGGPDAIFPYNVRQLIELP